VRVNYWNLLGTAGSWFILDVVFYGNGLFSGEVTEAMQFAHGPKSEATAALVLQARWFVAASCKRASWLYVPNLFLLRGGSAWSSAP
jgi:hypothetical protein